MTVRFIHAADIHLGYEQYSLGARANDFALAYFDMVAYAIEQRVDFVLLAGDLFHRASASALMLKQATSGLADLRAAGIPVVAVEGNHDMTHARHAMSWMEYLDDQGLLILLNVSKAENGYLSLPPYDPEQGGGSYVDIGEARIYGIKYLGAALPRVLEQVAPEIERGPFTILMLHAGLEGQVPHVHGGLTRGQIEPLRQYVDYLALGHIHKRLTEEWVFNPGSTETNSMEEIEWPHGFFDVTATPGGTVDVKAIESPHLRPFHRISVNTEGISTLEEFVQRVEEKIAGARGIREKAVIELSLGGIAPFKRQDVPIDRLRALIEMRDKPLVVRVRNNLVPPGVVLVDNRNGQPREEIERQVVEQLVYQQGDYRDSAAAWARLILDVKNMAIEKNPPDAIAAHVSGALATITPPDAVEDDPDLQPVTAPPEQPAAEEEIPAQPALEWEDW